jgi:hypothetical protein
MRLFRILLEEFDVFNAYKCLKKIYEQKLFDYELGNNCPDAYDFYLSSVYLVELIVNLINLLSDCGMTTEMVQTIKIKKSLIAKIKSVGFSDSKSLKRIESYSSLPIRKNYYDGRNFRTLLQIKNAFKYKLILKEKYIELKRIRTIRNKEEEMFLVDFIKNVGFISDAFPQHIKAKLSVMPTFIPRPFNQVRFNLLDIDQKLECIKSYQNNTHVYLINKYRKIRLQSLLELIIFQKRNDLISHIILECKLMQKIGYKGWRASYFHSLRCQNIIDLCNHYDKLSFTRFVKKVETLSLLHSKSIQKLRSEIQGNEWLGCEFGADEVHIHNMNFFKNAMRP